MASASTRLASSTPELATRVALPGRRPAGQSDLANRPHCLVGARKASPSLISSQALIEHLGAQYEGGPVLTRVPKDIPKRLAAHSIRTSKTYETAGDFWEEYLGKGS